MRKILVACVLVLASGCQVFVPQTVVDQTRTHAAVSDQVLKLWDNLSDAQKRTAYEKSRRGWYVQRLNITSEPLPPDLRAEATAGFGTLMNQLDEDE